MPGLERRLSPVILVVFALLYDLTSWAATETVGRWVGAVRMLPAGLVVILAVILVFDPQQRAQTWMRRVLRGDPVPVSSDEIAPQRGLLSFASAGPGIKSTECAIRYHYWGLAKERAAQPTLRHCWILTTGAKSEAAADEMVTKLRDESGIPCRVHKATPQADGTYVWPVDADEQAGAALRITFVPLQEEAAWDPGRIFKAVETVYTSPAAQELGAGDIVADYTGGTATMSSGMVLAGAAPHRRLQVMVPNEFEPDGRAKPGTDSTPRAINISFRIRPSGR